MTHPEHVDVAELVALLDRKTRTETFGIREVADRRRSHAALIGARMRMVVPSARSCAVR